MDTTLYICGALAVLFLPVLMLAFERLDDWLIARFHRPQPPYTAFDISRLTHSLKGLGENQLKFVRHKHTPILENVRHAPFVRDVGKLSYFVHQHESEEDPSLGSP